VQGIANRLLDAYENARLIDPISATEPDFDNVAAYAVLDRIAVLREQQGWVRVGRKIGFTNRTIWEQFGVDRPMWAHIWSTTVTQADGDAVLALDGLVQARIEPEVVFKLNQRPPRSGSPADMLGAVEWMAPGFEIVHCHFPAWKFRVADATADFGVHGALVVGKPTFIDDNNIDAVTAQLPDFELTLSRHGVNIDRGRGANVLDGPAHALSHLVDLLVGQPEYPPLAAGEIITTGTVTNMWPIAKGEQWTSDYGSLGIDGLTISFT
jgi:2-oxo-3-hexenedioate decarboxylase